MLLIAVGYLMLIVAGNRSDAGCMKLGCSILAPMIDSHPDALRRTLHDGEFGSQYSFLLRWFFAPLRCWRRMAYEEKWRMPASRACKRKCWQSSSVCGNLSCSSDLDEERCRRLLPLHLRRKGAQSLVKCHRFASWLRRYW